MSLRHRLVVMVLVLMAVAIAALDVVTSSEVHSFLFVRLDEQISGSAGPARRLHRPRVRRTEIRSGDSRAKTDPTAWLDRLDAAPQIHQPHLPAIPPTPSGGLSATDLENHIPPTEYVELIDTKGTLVFEHAIGPIDAPAPAPDLPVDLTGHDGVVGRPQPAGVRRGCRRGSLDPLQGRGDVGSRRRSGRRSIVGPDAVDTVSSLAHIEILVSVVVMLVLAALVLWTVRLGLRPARGHDRDRRRIRERRPVSTGPILRGAD